MKILSTLGLLFLLCCLPVAAQRPPEPSTQQPTAQPTPQLDRYRTLVNRAKDGDSSVDFAMMRDAYLEWLDDDKNKTDAPNRDQMVEAFKSKAYDKAVALAEVVLDYEYVNRGLHLAVADAYHQLGDETKANFHRDIAQKLLQALLSTGDGKSMKTAYRVMSVSEEYLIMRELGYELHSQALLSGTDGAYDELMGVDKKTGKKVDIYFNISSFFGPRKKIGK